MRRIFGLMIGIPFMAIGILVALVMGILYVCINEIISGGINGD